MRCDVPNVSSDVWNVRCDVLIVTSDVLNVVFFVRFFVLKLGFLGFFCYFWGSKGSFFVL